MRVTKTAITRYEIDLVNTELTGESMVEAVNKLAKAGVPTWDCKVEVDGRIITLTHTKKTYYDDGTLVRMEK